MLEINCQYWLDNYDMRCFSDSIGNSGCQTISSITWQNACEAILRGYRSKDRAQQIITSTVDRKQLVSFFEDFGAWSKSELNSMSNIELSALALQYIAANYNECDSIDDTDNGCFYEYNNDVWTTLSS